MKICGVEYQTRQYEVKDGYGTVAHVITSPGKFESEPAYVPMYWHLVLNGFSSEESEDENGYLVSLFYIENTDSDEFKELLGFERVYIWEDSIGFVHHKLG